MARIIENRKLSDDYYLMKVEEQNTVEMGQFYMLRSWDTFPVLSRPISICDADEDSLTFLYRVAGLGTDLFSKLKAGDSITLDGPHGSSFPDVAGKIALVGGGVGIAPLFLTAKRLKERHPDALVDIYLGFSKEPVLEEEFRSVADHLIVNTGGFVTDEIDTREYETIMTCGPEIMMKTLYEKCVDQQSDAAVYVSMESRMACGIGACLVCTCKTKAGNKRICREGPVLPGSEVFG